MAKKKAEPFTQEDVQKRADEIEAQSDPNGPLKGIFKSSEWLSGFMGAVSAELRSRKEKAGQSARRSKLDIGED